MNTQLTPSGRSFLDPVKLLERAGLATGMQVGDFGVGGAAYFGIQACKMVGERGVVYGIDVFKPALSGAESKAKLEGCRNFKPIWSNLEIVNGARAVKDGSVDFGILVNVVHASKKQKEVLTECARMMKVGARMLIIEWKHGGELFGPKPEHVIPADRVLDLCVQVGLAPFDQFDASQYHYGLVVVKAG